MTAPRAHAPPPDGTGRPDVASPERRLRDAGILEDGRAFFADQGAAHAGFLVERLWVEGGAGWIAGEPKTGKTWLICELILAITTGRRAFGEFECARPGRIAYVAEEGNRRKFQERLAGMCRVYGVALEDVMANLDVIWRRHVDLLDPAWQRDLEAIAARYRVIFLDPFRDMHDANEDRVHEVKPVLDFLRRLQEVGPAVIAVMHLKKSQGDGKKLRAGQRVAGSRHFHSFLDSALYTDPEKVDEDWPVKVSAEHRDEEALSPFLVSLEIKDRGFRLAAELGSGNRADSARLSEAVERARHLGPATKTALANRLGGRKQDALDVVNRCIEQGLLGLDGHEKVVVVPEPVPVRAEPLGTDALPLAGNPHRSAA